MDYASFADYWTPLLEQVEQTVRQRESVREEAIAATPWQIRPLWVVCHERRPFGRCGTVREMKEGLSAAGQPATGGAFGRGKAVLGTMPGQRPNIRSRMNREVHVRF